MLLCFQTNLINLQAWALLMFSLTTASTSLASLMSGVLPMFPFHCIRHCPLYCPWKPTMSSPHYHPAGFGWWVLMVTTMANTVACLLSYIIRHLWKELMSTFSMQNRKNWYFVKETIKEVKTVVLSYHMVSRWQSLSLVTEQPSRTSLITSQSNSQQYASIKLSSTGTQERTWKRWNLSKLISTYMNVHEYQQH